MGGRSARAQRGARAQNAQMKVRGTLTARLRFKRVPQVASDACAHRLRETRTRPNNISQSSAHLQRDRFPLQPLLLLLHELELISREVRLKR